MNNNSPTSLGPVPSPSQPPTSPDPSLAQTELNPAQTSAPQTQGSYTTVAPSNSNLTAQPINMSANGQIPPSQSSVAAAAPATPVNNNPASATSSKSSLVAGVLAITLGAFGVHDWYLDRQKKAKNHIILAVIWVILLVLSIILRTFAPSTGNLNIANIFNSIATTTYVLSWITILADITWGIIDGVLLLVQGDAGLIAQGYVATPQTQPNPTQPHTSVPSLPPAPTLAEQAPGGSAQPTPIVFNSANIQQSTPIDKLNQPLATKDVQAPPLTVQGADGKSTMNPVVLRRILIAAVVIIAAIVIAIIVKNGVSSTLASGYGATYRAAKELAPKINSAVSSASCEYAVTYVKAVSVSKSAYDGYVENCKSLAVGLQPLVEQLGQTPAINWDSTISSAYQSFREAYLEAFPGEDQAAKVASTLDLYQVWHNYLVTADLLEVNSPDSDFQAAADILRTSGNDTLAQYGEEWLARELDYLSSYRAYWDMSYTDPMKDALRTELENKREDLRNWVDDHRPDVTKISSFTLPDTAAVKTTFDKLYDSVKSAYETHYDSSSGDCNQAGNVVYCS